jgi:hypothetical protein
MDKETEAKVIAEAKEVMGDLFVPLSVESINWNPHPPTVGVRCVTEASDNHGGALTEAVFDKVGCEHTEFGRGRCGLPMSAHKCDVVLFVKLTRNCDKQEAQTTLSRVVPILEKYKIDGFTFVETPEKFRIG